MTRAPIRVAAAVVWRDGTILMTQRPPGGPLGLQWEFPGGKIEPSESVENALVREIEEELGVSAKTGAVLAVQRFTYPHGLEVEIHFVECTLDSFTFRPSPAAHAVRWLKPDQVPLDQVLAADREFLSALSAARKEG